MNQSYILGIDVGSTTVKAAILDHQNKVYYKNYRRHKANIQSTLKQLLQDAYELLGDIPLQISITGSGGLGLAKALGVHFSQEVVSVSTALKIFAPRTDVAIELGGEDAKIIYFKGGLDQRMNGICAGGTGSFIDQMASLLECDASTLNELAKDGNHIYPIAARCGVFAKTDLQALLNEGASKNDLARSIFQAVVNQTISALACGKPIRGNVAFLGGPLHFLDQLKERFIQTLNLTGDAIVDPEDSHLFAAFGAAMRCEDPTVHSLSSILDALSQKIEIEQEIARLEPLFKDHKEYAEFIARHDSHQVKKTPLSDYTGEIFLGVDAGSTTTKLALIGSNGELLYSFYSGNQANPIQTIKRAFSEIRETIHPEATIRYSCSTGYGEKLMQSALGLDLGEVETIAHFKAASFFDPEVDCIIDIGGQDMKCIKIKDRMVDSLMLNEACSSGCGSFIETFAKSLDYDIIDFAKEGIFSKQPVDLGSRCTVFMNSRVKQAQKEGASVADISSGLAYSVIKNALFKVIKFSSIEDLGKHVVVQGGTFYNNAVLKAFENIADAHVIRPDIAGIMGAFGSALIAKERYQGQKTHLLSFDEIDQITYESNILRCGKCSNNCQMTMMRFNDGRKFITGNKCERGIGKEKREDIPNLFDYKYKTLFKNKKPKEAPHGKIGIPRVLNMYENFPYWQTFFTTLGYEVVLSPDSTKKIYELGLESIPSESECYPAKIAHGHVQWLINQGIQTIFYPCIAYETRESKLVQNHYNCPIVTSYPENIENNVEDLKEKTITFIKPFLSFAKEEVLCNRLKKDLPAVLGVSKNEINEASKIAWQNLMDHRRNIQEKGAEVLKWLEEEDHQAIVLAGRPYHIDPEIHHGIAELITSYGFAVLTEDSISHMSELSGPLRVMDQWMYHSRLYRAAEYVKSNPRLNLIQLNSFGCGLDAVTTDGVSDILTPAGKVYTVLKIDEVSNLGAARIRIRSLIAALKERESLNKENPNVSSVYERVLFTEDMKKDYTILAPQMSPIHFDFLEPALRSGGYNIEILPESRDAVDIGLKYVNNDACYPSLIVVGQIMKAIQSGNYDLNKVAIIMSQTGGGCRASNYIGFIRRALEKANLSHIPVISASVQGLEKHPGFRLTPTILFKALQGIIYGDLFMNVLYRTRPYEKVPGSANALYESWKARLSKDLEASSINNGRFRKNIYDIVEDFDHLAIDETLKKPRVGVVGEILVKFLPTANNDIVNVLEREGAEAVMPPLLDFFLYSFYNANFKVSHFGANPWSSRLANLGITTLEIYRSAMKKALRKSNRFTSPSPIKELANMAKDYVSLGNQTGEGWFLTGEIMELIHTGVKNIVCTQPFACLPNHIVGKGVMKSIKFDYQGANIVAIDYDPGASEVNQLNRIKLMLSSAKDQLKQDLAENFS